MDIFYLMKTKVFIMWFVSELKPTDFVFQSVDSQKNATENNCRKSIHEYLFLMKKLTPKNGGLGIVYKLRINKDILNRHVSTQIKSHCPPKMFDLELIKATVDYQEHYKVLFISPCQMNYY